MESLVKIADILPHLNMMYEGGIDEGKRLGLATDEIFRWHSPCLLILTGYPNMGKSHWWDMTMVNSSVLYDTKHVVYSSENSTHGHFRKLVMKYVGKKFAMPDSVTPGMTRAEAKVGVNWVNKHFTWIKRPDGLMNLNEILELAHYLKEDRGCSSLVIDPWNSVDSDSHDNDSKHIANSLDKLRSFNEKHNFTTCIVAHPAKTPRDAKGQYPVPTANDIHGSYAWRAKADVILCFHRQDITSNRNQVHCQKIRETDYGMIGSVETDWDKVSGRFKQISEDFYELPYRHDQERPAYE